jgi:predicted nucleic acid-binding protein
MRVALDNNVMIYAEGAGDEVRRRRALSLIAAIRASGLLMHPGLSAKR